MDNNVRGYYWRHGKRRPLSGLTPADVARIADGIADWQLGELAKVSPLHRVKKKKKPVEPMPTPPGVGEVVRRRIVRKPKET